jgi:hypothetical protein
MAEVTKIEAVAAKKRFSATKEAVDSRIGMFVVLTRLIKLESHYKAPAVSSTTPSSTPHAMPHAMTQQVPDDILNNQELQKAIADVRQPTISSSLPP